MEYKEVLDKSSEILSGLKGKTLDILDINKPINTEHALHLAKIVSKLSPIFGNVIELLVVNELNKIDWETDGKWIRQDPGFPDALFTGGIEPRPGIEIKTWFPLATEVTARFKDSVSHFEQDQTNLALIAWLPEHIIYGKPKIVDVWVGSAKSFAIARDLHYHRPPDYLVFEPQDTSARTRNLQQTNTNGYKFQGTKEQLRAAEKDVRNWGVKGKVYDPSTAYQQMLRALLSKYPYRLDTNFSKIDRINHSGIEEFKRRVLNTKVNDHPIGQWAKRICNESEIGSLVSELVE